MGRGRGRPPAAAAARSNPPPPLSQLRHIPFPVVSPPDLLPPSLQDLDLTFTVLWTVELAVNVVSCSQAPNNFLLGPSPAAAKLESSGGGRIPWEGALALPSGARPPSSLGADPAPQSDSTEEAGRPARTGRPAAFPLGTLNKH